MEDELDQKRKIKSLVLVVIIAILLLTIGALFYRVVSLDKKLKKSEVANEEKRSKSDKTDDKEKENTTDDDEQASSEEPGQEAPSAPVQSVNTFFNVERKSIKRDEHYNIFLKLENGKITVTCDAVCHKHYDGYYGKALNDTYVFSGDYISAKFFLAGHDATDMGIIAINKDGTVSQNSFKNIVNGATTLAPNYQNLKNIVSIEGAIQGGPMGGAYKMVLTDINGVEYEVY